MVITMLETVGSWFNSLFWMIANPVMHFFTSIPLPVYGALIILFIVFMIVYENN